jgi:hypothetical protein
MNLTTGKQIKSYKKLTGYFYHPFCNFIFWGFTDSLNKIDVLYIDQKVPALILIT